MSSSVEDLIAIAFGDDPASRGEESDEAVAERIRTSTARQGLIRQALADFCEQYERETFDEVRAEVRLLLALGDTERARNRQGPWYREQVAVAQLASKAAELVVEGGWRDPATAVNQLRAEAGDSAARLEAAVCELGGIEPDALVARRLLEMGAAAEAVSAGEVAALAEKYKLDDYSRLKLAARRSVSEGWSVLAALAPEVIEVLNEAGGEHRSRKRSNQAIAVRRALESIEDERAPVLHSDVAMSVATGYLIGERA